MKSKYLLVIGLVSWLVLAYSSTLIIPCLCRSKISTLLSDEVHVAPDVPDGYRYEAQLVGEEFIANHGEKDVYVVLWKSAGDHRTWTYYVDGRAHNGSYTIPTDYVNRLESEFLQNKGFAIASFFNSHPRAIAVAMLFILCLVCMYHGVLQYAYRQR